MHEHFLYRITRLGWLTVCGAALLLFLILACFNQPSIDDFSYAELARHAGLVQSQLKWYNEWSGRYFSSFLLSINPIVFGSFTGYKVVTVLLLLTFFLSLFFTLRKMMLWSENRAQAGFAAAIGISLFVLLLPGFAEGFYWLASGLTYQWAAVMMMVAGWLAITTIDKKHGLLNRVIRILPGVLLLVFIAGSNELSLAATLCLLAFLLLYRWLFSKKFSWILFGGLIVLLIAGYISISAPGNDIRAELFEQKHSVIELSGQAAVSLFKFLLRIMPAFLLFSIIALIPWMRAGSVKAESTSKPAYYLHPLFSLLLIFALLYLLFWAGWYSTGAHLPARTENVPFIVLLLSWFWMLRNLQYLIIKKQWQISVKWANAIFILAITASLYFFARENNLRSAAGDLLLKRAYAYDKQSKQQRQEITACPQDTCFVSPVTARPVLLSIGDIHDAAFPGQYRAWCRYFGKKEIKISENP